MTTMRTKLDHHFALLLTAMNKREAADSRDVGGYYLDRIKPDAKRLYRIEEIVSAAGGTRCPMGERRYTAAQLIEVIRFAIEAVERSRA